MNTNAKLPKRTTARTTTVRIDPPADFSLLKAQYRLVRYVLPETLLFSKDKFKFARVHNQLKEQLDDVPYRSFTYDYLDGSRRWVIYVLYPRQNEANPLRDIQIEGSSLPCRESEFADPPFHILVKLLQVNYFGKNDPTSQGRFVGQDKCYIYARRRSEENAKYHICLEIEMKGDLQDPHTFYVYGQARTFVKRDQIDPAYSGLHTYYTLSEIRDNLLMFRQVKRNEITSNAALYEKASFPGSRTTLDFHDQDNVEQSRGYLVDTFIKSFVSYLAQYGFSTEHISREFQKYNDGSTADFELPVNLLGTVFVYDARFQKGYDLEVYISEFRKRFPDLNFQIIDALTSECEFPVLVVEDCEAKAFQENMPLFEMKDKDPHQVLYRQFPLLAKQFVNVNGNEPEKGDSQTEYLAYELDVPSEYQIKVSINQLFLKDLILRGRDVSKRLTLAPVPLMFVHRENRGRGNKAVRYEVAAYFEGNVIRFLDLSDPTKRDTFYEKMDGLGVDWDDCYDRLLARYKKRNDEDLTTYDVVIGPGLFIDIEDAHEALLYEYEEILRRLDEYNQAYALDDLKLAPHYDVVVGDPSLSESMLWMRGYIQKPKPLAKPKNRKHQDAVDLYYALQKYDALLDELKSRYDTITFRDLTGDEVLMERIRTIFDYKSRRGLRELYKAMGRFAGAREGDVIPVYQGIWYNRDDLRFVVGNVNSIEPVQARAHRVRQFMVYQGADSFDVLPLLDALSVKFVRLNQYTVSPYYFHLIDLYIDNVLVHQGGSSLAVSDDSGSEEF